MVLLSQSGIILPLKGALIWALVRRKPDLVGEVCEAEMVERG
jgi:hypothetical protein